MRWIDTVKDCLKKRGLDFRLGLGTRDVRQCLLALLIFYFWPFHGMIYANLAVQEVVDV